jgi:hypothetical protein
MLFEISQYKESASLTSFHLAFRAKSREQVRQFYEAALSAGGSAMERQG